MTITINQFIDMSKQTIIAATTALLAAAGIIALASCSSDDEIANSNYPDDNIVRITANVNDMATRASAKTENVTDMGFCINNTANKQYSYGLVKITKEGNAWKPEKQMLWQNDTQPVDVIAYAPYTEFSGDLSNTGTLETSLPVTIEETQTADSYKSDLLVYKKAGFEPKSGLDKNGAVPITFKHALSQLNITVKFGTELDAAADGGKLTANPINEGTLKVNGTVITGTCDFTKDEPTVAVNAGEATSVTPYESGTFVAQQPASDGGVINAYTSYSCILIPQTVASGFSVSFTIGDKTYTWTSDAAVTLEAGYNHTLVLNVGKDFVVAGTMTVKPWEDATESNINTD